MLGIFICNIPHTKDLLFYAVYCILVKVEFSIEKTAAFDEWFNDQSEKVKAQIRARFSRIEMAGHFGIFKSVGDGVLELKWKNGLRIYFAYLAHKKIIIILGGTKHGQKTDIKKAKSFLS